MKIKKVEDRPMVIHTKKKPKLHLHTGKKPVVRKKVGNTSVTVKRKRPYSGIRERLTESGKSVKVCNRSLKTMAAAGVRAGAGQIEGGEEIKESLDLAAVAATPVMGVTSGAGKLYRRKKAQKERKAGIEKKQKQRGARQAEISEHSGKNAGNKKRDKNKKRGNGKKDSSGKKRGRGSVNGAVKGRMPARSLRHSVRSARSRKI